MKIGIIGANGNVGTELCILLQNDCDVIPIVRNKIASAFLEYHGINCRLGDVANDESAKTLLDDLDIIVNATWVADRFSGSQNQTSKEINKKLIENCFKFSKKSATIVYLSTIRAFGNKVDPVTSKYFPPRYDVEKKFLDKIVQKSAKKFNKKGISFRCGHVFGNGQPNTIVLKKLLSQNKSYSLPVNPDNASNILHIVTLKDAIFKCIDKKIKSNTYSLVNNPQWSWKEVFDFYNSNSTLMFSIPQQKQTSINQKIFKLFKGKRKFMLPILYRVPKKYEPKIIKELSIRKYSSEISKINSYEQITNGNFSYVPIPGIQLPNLEKTKDSLKNYDGSVFL